MLTQNFEMIFKGSSVALNTSVDVPIVLKI